jgi:hypothetical protein
LLAPSAFTVVPGLSQTFTVPANARVYIASHGGASNNATTPGTAGIVDIALSIDGANPDVSTVPDFYHRLFVANASNIVNGLEYWSMSGVVELAPGVHTFDIRTRHILGNAVTVSGDGNSVLQGSLTVLILKT